MSSHSFLNMIYCQIFKTLTPQLLDEKTHNLFLFKMCFRFLGGLPAFSSLSFVLEKLFGRLQIILDCFGGHLVKLSMIFYINSQILVLPVSLIFCFLLFLCSAKRKRRKGKAEESGMTLSQVKLYFQLIHSLSL